MLTIQQITNSITRSEAATWLKTTLTEFGFSTTGWQESRNQLQLLNSFASTISGAAQLAASFVELGFNSSASGAGLKIYSENRFNNIPVEAQKTAGPMTFTNSSTSPQTQDVGAILVTDDLGVQFSNTETANIPASGSVQVEMEAVLAGESGNIGNDSLLSLVTPIAGVTVTNPSPGTDSEGAVIPWYTTRTGADPETDRELRQRNSTKWGNLATEKTRTAVENLALEQDGCSKVFVDDQNPRGPYTVDVYTSADLSLMSDAQMEAAQLSFSENTFMTSPDWPAQDVGSLPSSYALFKATALELVLVGTVYYDPQFTETQITTELNARLDGYLSAVPIGGYTYASTVQNVITIGDLYEVIEGTIGVLSVTLNTGSITPPINPAGNISVPAATLITNPAGSNWVQVGRLELVKSDT